MKKNIKKINKKNQGSVLAVSLIILGMILTIALSVALASIRERKASMTSSKSDVAYQNAESGVEKAMEVILQDLRDGDENAAGEIPISTVTISKIGYCDGANEYAIGDNWKVQLVSDVDADGNGSPDIIDCNNNSLDIYEVKSIKSVGEDPQSQTQRAINAAMVQKDPNIKLLLHADGTNGSINFKDSSRTHHSVNSYGDASVDTGEKVFASGSASFDGDGDYLDLAGSQDWKLETNSFAIDFWLKADTSGSPSNIQTLFEIEGEVEGSYDKSMNIFTVTFDTGASAVFCPFDCSSYTLYNENWHHVALVRDSGSSDEVRLYIDGSSVTGSCSSNYSLGSASAKIYIGCDNSGSECFKGYLDELRLYKGVGFNGSTIIVPSEPY